mmetsp:Transcript_8540/g.18653  ORF Transcript_8540/g.18653 Transcript_8540/m.18653 type:complete len:143 (-) Transcript_8540:367-795(-)
MNTGKDAEWTIHTSRRLRRSTTATVTPARKPEITKQFIPKPEIPTTARKPETTKQFTPKSEIPTKPTPQPEPQTTTRNPEPPKTNNDDNYIRDHPGSNALTIDRLYNMLNSKIAPHSPRHKSNTYNKSRERSSSMPEQLTIP